MKTVWRISWILGLIIGVALFLGTFLQFPSANMARVLGQLAGSLGVGAVVFLITYGIGALVVRVKNRN
jgi:purine-cytosine permease-like protein